MSAAGCRHGGCRTRIALVSILDDLGQAAQSGLALPTVIGERCVHSRTEIASCRTCVDACPTGAWVIDDEMLGIDEGRCDGCDLCVPVCPEGAIVTRFAPATRTAEGQPIALAHCGRAGIEDATEALMPCVHAIGTGDLLRLHRDGARYVITCTADCETCDRGGAARLEQRGASVNAMLSDRAADPLILRRLDKTHWTQLWLKVNTPTNKPRLSRRAFFRSAVERPVKRLEEAIETAEGTFQPPGALLPRVHPGDRLPFVPAIDAERCNGCGSCLSLCPHDAIRVEDDDAGRAYRITAEQCTGCRLCGDICEQGAIKIEAGGMVTTDRIPLQTGCCPACSVAFHRPAPPGSGDETDEIGRLCRICSKTNHYKDLYQVLD